MGLVCIQWGIHKGDIQDLWRKIQGTPEGTLTHPCTQHPDRTQHHPWKLQNYREEGPWPNQNYQGINIHWGNNPTLNRNVGKYNLHNLWDRFLFNTPDLKINNDNGHAHRTSLSGHTQSIATNKHLNLFFSKILSVFNDVCPTFFLNLKHNHMLTKRQYLITCLYTEIKLPSAL